MNKVRKWIKAHKLAVALTIIGCGLWAMTGIDYFILLAPLMLVAGLALRALPRTFIWAAIGAYGALVMPNGWVLAIVLILIVTMCFPAFRNITPLGDFKAKKEQQEA
ncbi:hypothetical protein BI49514_02336 [Brevibacterium iodinum ATCC 49514]|uniref:Uncharacterized protein n=1 Tax=Brevibacterium iodinum ATCC 49514 TaxID=1255616 RepID=A0A2H1JTL0_9MICO|nr:hypothetical protein [Brevibacterium iodinum]SMX90773.1 hypothetical protein BI49514_02336 [Brevibacterium iodinum ATCC 49514]SUW12421.1 Uncharacterised protein [Brevibacterium iodinum]